MNARPPLASLLSGLSLALGLLATNQPPARAHAIESSLERVSGLTDSLTLESRFGTGEPAADAQVRLVAPDGSALPLGRTDPLGTLRFQLPEGVGPDWELVVDQGPGHRDYLELPLPDQERLSAGPQFLLKAAPLTTLTGLTVLGGLGCARFRRRRR